MKHNVYRSILSKISIAVPWFGKAMLDVAIQKRGFTPDTVGPLTLLQIIDEINPKLSRHLTDCSSILLVGSAQVLADTDDQVTFVNTEAKKIISCYAGHEVKDPKEQFRILHQAGFIAPTKALKNLQVRERFDQNLKRHYNISISPIWSAGVISGVSSVIQDITIKKALENELHSSYESLEEEVHEREKIELALKNSQKASLSSAHQAGMAEIATEVLHNIGNILNSLNIGVEAIQKTINNSEHSKLILVNNMIQQHTKDLSAFLANDQKGKKIPDFLVHLEKVLSSEFKHLKVEADEVLKRVQLIKDVIASQQTHAKGGEFKEEVFIPEIVEDALAMQFNALIRHDIKVIKKFQSVAPVLAQKPKLIHVLLNLIKNSKEAMSENNAEQKILAIEIGAANDNVFIKITDSGQGIPKENLSKIFVHGFTTKPDGHGFGLHYCANALTEMGGSLSVTSDGPNKGTTFTILLPQKSALKTG